MQLTSSDVFASLDVRGGDARRIGFARVAPAMTDAGDDAEPPVGPFPKLLPVNIGV
jgi:hypothetical protein